MGNLYDYFAASSDEAAATAIERVGGPGSQTVYSDPQPRRGVLGFLGLRERLLIEDPSLVPFDAVETKGVDPYMNLIPLEALLTGRAELEIEADPRCAKDVVLVDDGQAGVLTLTDSLQAALADASGERLRDVAVPWSQDDEFYGDAEPEPLAEFLQDLADLARRAREGGDRLYCWFSV